MVNYGSNNSPISKGIRADFAKELRTSAPSNGEIFSEYCLNGGLEPLNKRVTQAGGQGLRQCVHVAIKSSTSPNYPHRGKHEGAKG